MDQLCEAVAEIAKMIRQASKDTPRTFRVVVMTMALGATVVGVAVGVAKAFGHI